MAKKDKGLDKLHIIDAASFAEGGMAFREGCKLVGCPSEIKVHRYSWVAGFIAACAASRGIKLDGCMRNHVETKLK